LQRIQAIYAIEADINRRPIEQRYEIRGHSGINAERLSEGVGWPGIV
jgi:hypothetical protein